MPFLTVFVHQSCGEGAGFEKSQGGVKINLKGLRGNLRPGLRETLREGLVLLYKSRSRAREGPWRERDS